jgi:hypothetical protein
VPTLKRLAERKMPSMHANSTKKGTTRKMLILHFTIMMIDTRRVVISITIITATPAQGNRRNSSGMEDSLEV